MASLTVSDVVSLAPLLCYGAISCQVSAGTVVLALSQIPPTPTTVTWIRFALQCEGNHWYRRWKDIDKQHFILAYPDYTLQYIRARDSLWKKELHFSVLGEEELLDSTITDYQCTSSHIDDISVLLDTSDCYTRDNRWREVCTTYAKYLLVGKLFYTVRMYASNRDETQKEYSLLVTEALHSIRCRLSPTHYKLVVDTVTDRYWKLLEMDGESCKRVAREARITTG